MGSVATYSRRYRMPHRSPRVTASVHRNSRIRIHSFSSFCLLSLSFVATVEIGEVPLPLRQKPVDLPAIPGGWTDCEWSIEGRSFRLFIPAVPDAFIEDPEVHAAFDRDEYMPYWAYLWPAALKMSATILATRWPENAEILEIGAGIGIVGLAGLSLGLNVTISDYEPKAVELPLAQRKSKRISTCYRKDHRLAHASRDSIPGPLGLRLTL